MPTDFWDKYILEILDQLGAKDWNPDQCQKMQTQVSETFQVKLMADITNKLNSSQKLTLKTMLTENKTPVQVINYLYSTRPDMMQIVETSMKEFKQELLS